MTAGMDDHLPKPETHDPPEAMPPTGQNSDTAPEPASGPVDAPASESAIDLARLAEMLGLNDLAAITELLSMFASELPNLLRPIAQALAARDRNALARAAHACKGAARCAAAQRLAELSAAMERDAKASTFVDLESSFAQLQAESARVLAQVAQLRSSSGGRP